MLRRLEKKEEELFRAGPLAVLTTSVQANSQVTLSHICHSLALVKAQ